MDQSSGILQPVNLQQLQTWVDPLYEVPNVDLYCHCMPTLNEMCTNLARVECRTDTSADSFPHSSSLIKDEKKIDEKIRALQKELGKVKDDSLTIIVGKRKTRRQANSDRRSSFIGVSRNGPNWQAMISIRKKKTYIGTFEEERFAAEAFDFHSVLIHGLNAKTNFSYSKGKILEMMKRYQSNGNRLVFPE